jgi:hypothetical protein
VTALVKDMLNRPWVKTTESVFGHLAAVVLGVVMMIVGLGLGVTMIMLPVGVVVGLVGVALVVVGLFAHFDDVKTSNQPRI